MWSFFFANVEGMRVKDTMIKYFRWIITCGLCGSAFTLGALFFLFAKAPIDFSVLENYDPGKPSIVLDDKDEEWTRFQVDKRQPLELAQIPEHVRYAFIAAEDWDFFYHHGISFKGIIRSSVKNLLHGRIVEGASTITQQLVKLLFFDSQKTFQRKIKEQFLSLLVERQFTKEQILETYLNHVYFGCGIYGVEAAAQRFWGVSVDALTPDQSALLAGIVKSPGNYSPLLYPLSSVQRRNIILGQMKKLKKLTEDEFQDYSNRPLNLCHAEKDAIALHFKEMLRGELEEKYGRRQLYCGGLIIKTTLNSDMQKKAEKEFVQHFKVTRLRLGNDLDGGLISLETKTGHIKVLIGGVDFFESQFNRAIQARRQQGSVFKPVLYAAALNEGMSMLGTALDEPLIVQQGNQLWEPKNHDLLFHGSMTLARALSYSSNIISAKTILAIGPKKVAQVARLCGLSGPIPEYPSLSLGCIDSTVYEVAGMFNIFANDGVYVKPEYLLWIKDKWGKKIYKAEIHEHKVIEPKIAHQINKVLTFGLNRKKEKSKKWLDSVAISKTGTTNDSRTCWFAGSTPEITTVLYAGTDDNRSLGKNIYPVYTSYPIWMRFHRQISTKTKFFSYDSSLRKVFADIKTGKIVQKLSGEEVFELLV
ncbi:transglycosylase domain-containing protein [Candidatus Babeliales bacterium]|nr:transglycosylase domain-containing protein [Candidatus Babeliales bacterium]